MTHSATFESVRYPSLLCYYLSFVSVRALLSLQQSNCIDVRTECAFHEFWNVDSLVYLPEETQSWLRYYVPFP